jgi:GNAT superfamily N-acetyltransferase
VNVNLFDVIEATWPAAAYTSVGSFTRRKGAGGGKRVSATTLNADFDLAEFQSVADDPLFSVRSDQSDFDGALDALGYQIVDPSILYECPIELFASQELPRVTAFDIWPPLQIMCDVWDVGGISKQRRDVMERATCEKTSILGRITDRAAGAAFAGLYQGVTMVHALEIDPDHRRKGLAGSMMICAAKWGVSKGSDTFAVVTTEANEAANALYTTLGMTVAGRYHYRKKPD